jgi:hypothetical protein
VGTYAQLDGYANVAEVAQQVGVRKQLSILEENDKIWKQILPFRLGRVIYCTQEKIRTMLQWQISPGPLWMWPVFLASYRTTPDVFAYSASKTA